MTDRVKEIRLMYYSFNQLEGQWIKWKDDGSFSTLSAPLHKQIYSAAMSAFNAAPATFAHNPRTALNDTAELASWGCKITQYPVIQEALHFTLEVPVNGGKKITYNVRLPDDFRRPRKSQEKPFKF